MKIYLDTNVLIDIEDGKISRELIQSIGNLYDFYYSYTHLQELLESTRDFTSRIEKRLSNIESLTLNKYIYPYNGCIECITRKPSEVVSALSTFPFIRDGIYLTANKMVNRDLLIKTLQINLKEINNYNPETLINQMNHATSKYLDIEFSSLIEASGSTIREKITTLFNIFDLVGFWKDEYSVNSNLARIYDASHAYFATYCDIFVSEDKRARNKAKVAYSYLGIKTHVKSFQEFIEIPINTN